ncbi:MAG TPA: hypothetical protein VGQ89_15715 [Candidatus Limnocylindrales bacterium]|jgi:hypothetical protein|nr:hypothetical protein [Candidatus Limnocylindrales bacterium]
MTTTAPTVSQAVQLARIQQAIELANRSFARICNALEHAPHGSAARSELVDAWSDLEVAIHHLEVAHRLVDPTSADPVVRRADEQPEGASNGA